MADAPSVPWQLSARDATLREVRTLAGYTSLSVDLRWLDVGTWQLTLPMTHPALSTLAEPDAGIVMRATGSADVLCSGFVTDLSFTLVGDGTGVAEVSGVTDEAVLAGEQAYPGPSFDIPTTALFQFPTASADKTGPAETVLLAYISENIGPAAVTGRRRYPWLTLPVSAGRGPAVTRKLRGDNLLDAVRSICIEAGLGVTVRQGEPGRLQVAVTVPVTRPQARFSPRAGNLTALQVNRRAPQVTEVIVMGENERATRTFTRRNAAGAQPWVYRRSRWIDQGGTDTLAGQQQAADEQLASDGESLRATIGGTDTPGLRYGVHYQLGDRVSVGVAGLPAALLGVTDVTSVVTAVQIAHAPGSASRTTVSIGPADDDTAALDVQLQRLAQQLAATLRR